MAKKNLIQEGSAILSENTVMVKKDESTLGTVIACVDDYAAGIEEIMMDYIADLSMIREVLERTRQLRESIANPVGMLQLDRETRCKQLEDFNKQIIHLKEEVDERDDTIKELRKELTKVSDEIVDQDKEIEKLTDEIVDQDKEIEKLTDDVDELKNKVEELEETAPGSGSIVIKGETLSMVQRDQLEAFLTTIIYPHFNQQVANLNF